MRAKLAFLAILGATIAQLLFGAVSGAEQFDGKAFGARLLAYPAMMLLVPALWWRWPIAEHRIVRWYVRRRHGHAAAWLVRIARERLLPPRTTPWTAFSLIALPFLIDVTGNTLDLYDSVTWWDDLNHFVNWALLCGGLGLLLARTNVRPRPLLALTICGTGAILAIIWELGEYFAFIRGGTELATAYEDTLGDLTLGTLGALLAGVVVATRAGRAGR